RCGGDGARGGDAAGRTAAANGAGRVAAVDCGRGGCAANAQGVAANAATASDCDAAGAADRPGTAYYVWGRGGSDAAAPDDRPCGPARGGAGGGSWRLWAQGAA